MAQPVGQALPLDHARLTTSKCLCLIAAPGSLSNTGPNFKSDYGIEFALLA